MHLLSCRYILSVHATAIDLVVKSLFLARNPQWSTPSLRRLLGQTHFLRVVDFLLSTQSNGASISLRTDLSAAYSTRPSRLATVLACSFVRHAPVAL